MTMPVEYESRERTGTRGRFLFQQFLEQIFPLGLLGGLPSSSPLLPAVPFNAPQFA